MSPLRVVWIAWLVASCTAGPTDHPADEGFLGLSKQVKGVLTIRAGNREVPFVVRSRGKTVASDRFQVKSPEGGAKVQQVFVEIGQTVEAGQPLIKFEEEEIRLKLDLARSEIEEAELAVEQLRRGERTPVLETPIEIEEGEQSIAKPAPEKPEESIERYEATIDRARNEIELLESQIQDLQINSPIAGVVTKRETTAEQAEEEGKLLLEVVRIDPLHFSFEVPLEAVPALERGASVGVKFAAMANRQATGEIVSIGAEAGGHEQVEVRLALPNENLALKGEMAGEVVLNTPLTKKVITVPEKALLRTERSAYVFLVEKGKARKKAVEVEGEAGGQPIVEKGIGEGDLVIISEVEDLKDGEMVETQTIAR